MTRLHQNHNSPLTNVLKNKRNQKYKTSRKHADNAKGPETHSKIDLQCKPSYTKCVQDLNEAEPLVKQEFEPLKERWIALSLFCTLMCTQNYVWNTWSPIANSAMNAFPEWHENLIALLSNWGCITYLVCCVPCCWLVHKKGIIIPLRMAAILTTIATFVRCLYLQETVFTILVHMAAILNGLCGVIIGPMTALVSAVWFPHTERTTATGISSACNQIGMAISYLIGPAVVNFIPVENKNLINHNTNTFIKKDTSSVVRNFNYTVNRIDLYVQIMSLMRIEFVAQVFVLLGILCFFPKEPCHFINNLKISPQFNFLESIACLFKNKNMWKLCLAVALSQGITGPWLAMMTITFKSIITQEEVDRLAFWTVICSVILSLLVSRITDIYQGHLKLALCVLLTISTIMFLWVLFLDNRILIFHKEELYAAVIFAVSASWSTPPLFLELASEIAFPVSEAIVGGYMIFLSNLIGTLFYFSYFLSIIDQHWLTFCVFGNLFIAAILVIYVKEEYNRLRGESRIQSNVKNNITKLEDKQSVK